MTHESYCLCVSFLRQFGPLLFIKLVDQAHCCGGFDLTFSCDLRLLVWSRFTPLLYVYVVPPTSSYVLLCNGSS